MFKIKSYLNDAVEGYLLEPVSTVTSGNPTGNLSEVELQTIK